MHPAVTLVRSTGLSDVAEYAYAANLATALRAAGAGLTDVVSTRVLVVDAG